jgi:eukaryotic-like serine/threonine-protein kinase
MPVLRAKGTAHLGQYELGERLGAGGMAEVFVARRAGPRGFHKKFAIKRILPQLARDSRFVAMFCDEARICAALAHPNIVQVVDFGEADGELFMALEYVDGVSVAKLLRSVAARGQRFPLGAALFIVNEVLRALAFAHEARDEHGHALGIVHRDVSPGNVLIGRAGEVKLTDFGIVRASFIDRRTYPGELKGKLGYMSPEQVIGGDIDRRSDLFTLAIVLAEMLLARPMFPGRNELEILTRIYEADLRVLERHGSDLAPELLAMLRKALAREREQRFQSAPELAEALGHAAQAAGVSLSEAELLPWLASLGILPSHSGLREAASYREGLTPPTPRVESLPKAPELPLLIPSRRPSVHAPSIPAPSISVSSIPAPYRPDMPTAPPPEPGPTGDCYHLRARGGALIGPLPYAAVIELVATGRVDLDTMFSSHGASYRPLRTVDPIAALANRPAYRFSDQLRLRALWRRSIDRVRLPASLYELALGRETGLLMARSGRRQKRIYLEDGAVRFIASTDKNELLGSRLVDAGLVSRPDVETAVVLASERKILLGEALVNQSVLRPTALLRALSDQLEARFIEVLGWSDGELVFVRGEKSGEHSPSSVLGPLELLTRGVRENYSSAELFELMGPLRSVAVARSKVRRVEPARLGLSPLEQRALELAPSATSIEQLVSTMSSEHGGSAEETLRVIFIGLSSGVLAAAGWVTPG